MKAFKFLPILALLVSQFGYASMDVRSHHGTHFIEVKKTSSGVSFKLCGADARACVQLGNKNYYSVEELQDQHIQELLEATGAGSAIVVGAIFGPLLTPFVFGTIYPSSIMLIAASGMGAGAVLTVEQWTGSIDPFEQYSQAQTLDSNVINDQDVVVDDVMLFARRLDLVLSKI